MSSLKTAIVDVNDLIGGMDRKQRLAPRIAQERGWQPATVSTWVIVGQARTNERRIASHRAVLRAAFPHDGRHALAWLRAPHESVQALSTWPYASSRSAGQAGRQRVSRPNPGKAA